RTVRTHTAACSDRKHVAGSLQRRRHRRSGRPLDAACRRPSGVEPRGGCRSAPSLASRRRPLDAMTPVLERVDRAFEIEPFRDYLALEAGNSANTVEAYARDIRRLGEFAVSKGIAGPAQIKRALLRDFVYLLKDLGLSAATIRRQISAIRT